MDLGIYIRSRCRGSASRSCSRRSSARTFCSSSLTSPPAPPLRPTTTSPRRSSSSRSPSSYSPSRASPTAVSAPGRHGSSTAPAYAPCSRYFDAWPSASTVDDMTREQLLATDELDAILHALPPELVQRVRGLDGLDGLLEIVMDLGRLPEARFAGREEILSQREVTAEDIAFVISRIGQFGGDNRAGIERTLHRISALRNRAGKVGGPTLRVGRAVYGTMEIIRDVVEAGRSILLLGRPGVGKTTLLREVARVLAELGKRVVIVDTSNEIAGDGDIPHPGIGRARRMQVATPSLQPAVMIEAGENHLPEVVATDASGTEQEAAAARTIAERGVQLIATAHGNTLENLMLNPTLSDLVGGIQTVTLGDEEARRRGTQKSILERKAPPTFDVVVEIQSWSRVAVHANAAEAVDNILRSMPRPPLVRFRDETGGVRTEVPMPGAALTPLRQ